MTLLSGVGWFSQSEVHSNTRGEQADTHTHRNEAKVKPWPAQKNGGLGKTRQWEVFSKVCSEQVSGGCFRLSRYLSPRDRVLEVFVIHILEMVRYISEVVICVFHIWWNLPHISMACRPQGIWIAAAEMRTWRKRMGFQYISNDPSFHQKHSGDPDGSDGSDGTSYPLTKNDTLHVAQAMGPAAYVPPVLFGDIYAPSERHVCYTLCSGCSYAEAVYTMPGFFRNAAGAPGNHSYYLSFNDFQNLCIQFLFSSRYLCIYIATYRHTVHLDWQHAVIVSNSRCAWRWRLSERPPPLPLYLRTPAVAD